MLLDFYQFREQPFGVTPDPRYLYFSPGHREALASLFYGIESGRGFLALIAEPGMGKTTLLFQLLDRLKDSVRSVFLFQTQCDSRELLRYVLSGLGLDTCNGDFVLMHAKLNEYLFREAQADRRVVLFIDEAQNLSNTVLETVRLLSDFEAADRKLFQIVLAGQPELANRLLRPGMSQLRQRISILTHLDPLPTPEIARYISHRLQVAGYTGPELFTPAALAMIAEHSQGVPRNINNICFSALSIACAERCKKIGTEIVQEALADLRLSSVVQQTPHVVAPQVPAVLPEMPPQTWGEVEKRRPAGWLRLALLTVAISGLLIYFGARNPWAAHRPAIQKGAATSQETPRMDSQPANIQPVEVQMDTQKDAPAPASNDDDSTFLLEVRPNDTLSKLCERAVGRYDAGVFQEIQKLNWNLWDPDHIEVGQQIRFPRQLSIAPSVTSGKKATGKRNRRG